MSYFIFPHEEGTMLETPPLLSALQSMPRVEEFSRYETNRFFEAEWVYRTDALLLHCWLMKDGRAVKIEEEELAACEFALSIRPLLGVEVDITDDQYSFHLALTAFSSASELWRAIEDFSRVI